MSYSPTHHWQLRQVVKTLERIVGEIYDQKTADAIQAHADGLVQVAETLAQIPTGLNGLTPQQRRIFDFIFQRIAKHGEAPTRKEIMTEFSFSSPNGAQDHLKALQRKGMITLTGEPRGILINELPEN